MTAYFDCFSGIAGDMTVAALLDAGADWDELQRRLALLGLPGYTARLSTTQRSAISAKYFEVLTEDPPSDHNHGHAHGHAHDHGHDHGHDHAHGHHHHAHGRRLSDITRMIAESGLPDAVKANALAVFRVLGEAEAKVHDVPVEEIHFHEVGAVDSIVDIVGACICLDLLGVTRIVCSPLPVGRGMVKTAHGLMPIPAPATAQICRGIPTYPVDVQGELVTPTGAALMATLAQAFGPPPTMTARAVGYGAGTMDLGERPNLLRVTLGDESEPAALSGWDAQDLLLLETNIDDMNPQVFEHVMDLCFAAGARDVTLTPIQMKKNRAGMTLSVLCTPAERDAVLGILAAQTTTLGVRAQPVQRLSLPRRTETVETAYGPVEVKVASLPGGGEKAHPEYDSARQAAHRHAAPLQDVMRAALAAFRQHSAPTP